MESKKRLSSNLAYWGSLAIGWLAFGLLLLPLLAVPRLLSGSPVITGDLVPAVPNLPPVWIQSIRGYVTIVVVAAYPLSLWAAAVWARRLRQRERYALSLFPIGLPVLVASPLLAIIAADQYREATAAAVIRDLVTDGSRAWVTASSDNEHNAWLATIDLSSSGEPREHSVTRLRRQGRWVFSEPRRDRWRIVGVTGKAVILDNLGDGISVLDLQSEEQIHLPNDHYRAAALAHPDLLLAVTFDGMIVYDLKTPRSKRIVARVPQRVSRADVEPQHVQVMKGRRALVVSQDRELWAFDFEYPSSPRRRGKWGSAASTGPHISGAELAAAGPLGLVLSDYAHLYVIDFSDPDHPAQVGRLTLPEPVHRLTASGTLAAMATLDEPARVLLVDLSQPRTPTLAARVIPPGRRFSSERTGFAGTNPAFSVAGTRMLLAAGNVLQVLDVSRPSSPRVVGELQLSGL